MAVQPDFFIVGAPKCATGSIDAMLDARPDVSMARKDLHFFAPDLETTQFRLTRAEYEALFTGATPGVLLGESSVGYLNSATAAEAIRRHAPHAKIVMALRNPLTAVPSLHQHCLYYGIEEIEDLGDALDAEADRRAGRRLPRRCAHPWMLAYTRVYDYLPQVQRYLDCFGAERCHIVLYDDFRRDATTSMDALARFLELPPSSAPPRDVRLNRGRDAHSRRLSALLTDPPPLIRRIAHTTTPQRVRRLVADGILAVNTANTANTRSVGPEVRSRLGDALAGQVDALSILLGRDLSRWLVAEEPQLSAAADQTLERRADGHHV